MFTGRVPRGLLGEFDDIHNGFVISLSSKKATWSFLLTNSLGLRGMCRINKSDHADRDPL